MTTFYGRPLKQTEQDILDAMAVLAHGESMNWAGVRVTRGNWAPYWYVTNRSDYTCETGSRVETAVHVSNLAACYGSEG